MEGQRFDELARRLAQPISRRRLVKAGLATAVGGLAARSGVGNALAAGVPACASSADCPPGQRCLPQLCAKPCQTLADCCFGQVCLGGACVSPCHVNSDCAAGQVCDASGFCTNPPGNGRPHCAACEALLGGICVAPPCVNNADCNPGQICSHGACAPAPPASAVQSCDVIPNPAQVPAGQTFQFAAIGRDSTGQPVPFTGFTWFVASGGATVDPTGLVTAGAGTGDVTITAAAGNSTTCSATVRVTPPGDGLTITQIGAVANSKGQATAGVTFTDGDPAGTLSQYSGTIDWGDGTSSAASFTANPSGGFAAGGVHTYGCACLGPYTVKVTIRDLGFAGAVATTTVSVPFR